MRASFQVLDQYVRRGDVRLVQVVGIPRSMSTALERSLAEMEEPAAYVNEPFNVGNGDIDIAAGHVLDAFHGDQHPAVIVTKSLAPQVSAGAFEAWMSVCESVVWSIRPPLIQLGSLATRVVNQYYIPQGHPVVDQSAVYPYLERLTQDWVGSNFELPGWSALGKHYTNRPTGKPSVVIDGEDLVSHPTFVLQAACEQLPYIFSSNMVNGWRIGTFNNANHAYPSLMDENGLPLDVWIRKAAAANGLEENTRPPIDITRIPAALREYIEKTAIPTYKKLSTSRIRPPRN